MTWMVRSVGVGCWWANDDDDDDDYDYDYDDDDDNNNNKNKNNNKNNNNDNNNSNNNDDIEFNFISTRHLIIRIQGYLLSMELDNNTNILRNDKWTDRKHKIELLLHVITELQRYF